MVKKSAHPHDGKSLKTVLIYAAIVALLILASLTWKTILIIQQSKYNDQHFTLAIAQNEKVKKIVVFNPSDSSMSVLIVTDDQLKLSELPKQTAILTDGKIDVSDQNPDVIKDDIAETLFTLAMRYPTLKKDITIVDAIKLGFYANNLPPNKEVIKEVTSAQLVDDPLLEKTLIRFLSDDIVATENISIQIINASGVSGIGHRLERVLLHKGANVVAVTTGQKKQQKSSIEYFGNETYTLEKMRKLLNLPIAKLDKETIADIVITIGEDSKNTLDF